ncbi:MAG: hypothetical protein GAK33_07761 [Burkholderia lata]|uniref:Uncharacterized protein n=1 Tax=Burkholderia lata (strain ATCC 17760 / DSM 23089 / LMG 22485 / NCIMB 9086 / R18194 / 383) TaxID=482957 RepID=A0A833PIF8_BURL3|nr:MAG: hypothetical protein GAK33_07761 [Burkholderia lata]
MAPADNALPCRSENGFNVTNTMPALELFVKPFTDSPGNATALSTPGCFSAIEPMSRITFSVRSSDAPFGSCANAIRYSLSCAGTKPPGTTFDTSTVAPTSTRYTPSISVLRDSTPRTPRP